MADPNAFTQLREAIPAIRHYHCLNSGGVAPTPQATLDLQQSFYDREAVMTTTSPDLRDVYNTELGALRAEIAALLGAEPDEIALIRAVSEAVSFVAAALELQPGDRVILTAAEHPSGYLAWLTLRDRLGLELVAIEANGDDQAFLRDMEQAMTPNTRAICLSHVTHRTRDRACRSTGSRRWPASEESVTVVDAAQSFGARPADMRQLGCDVMAFPAFKWSMGPYGIGAMYVRRDAQERLHPWGSGSGAAAESDFPPGHVRLHPDAQTLRVRRSPLRALRRLARLDSAAERPGPGSHPATQRGPGGRSPRRLQRPSRRPHPHTRAGRRRVQGSSRSAWKASPEPRWPTTASMPTASSAAPPDGHTAVRLSFHAFNDASDIQAAAAAFEDFPRLDPANLLQAPHHGDGRQRGVAAAVAELAAAPIDRLLHRLRRHNPINHRRLTVQRHLRNPPRRLLRHMVVMRRLPRMMQPKQITTSGFSASISSRAATGNSYDPGTHAMVWSPSATP